MLSFARVEKAIIGDANAYVSNEFEANRTIFPQGGATRVMPFFQRSDVAVR